MVVSMNLGNWGHSGIGMNEQSHLVMLISDGNIYVRRFTLWDRSLAINGTHLRLELVQ